MSELATEFNNVMVEAEIEKIVSRGVGTWTIEVKFCKDIFYKDLTLASGVTTTIDQEEGMKIFEDGNSFFYPCQAEEYFNHIPMYIHADAFQENRGEPISNQKYITLARDLEGYMANSTNHGKPMTFTVERFVRD